MEQWIDIGTQIFGLIGCFMVAVPFLLGSSLGMASWAHGTWRFIITNFIGGIILFISLCFHFNLGSFVIEIFWITGGIVSIYKKLRSV